MLMSKFLTNESLSPVMHLLTVFHEFALGVIFFVLILVLGASMSLVTNSYIRHMVVTPQVELI